MLFFGVKNRHFRTGVFLVFTVWALLAGGLMYRDLYIVDPPNPARTGTEVYGHNSPENSLLFAVLFVEYLMLLAVLLPFSFSRFYWVRLIVLQIAFGGWLLLLAMAAMHSGGVYMIHLLAVLIVNAVIFALLAASALAEIVNRRRNRLA